MDLGLPGFDSNLQVEARRRNYAEVSAIDAH